jgi:hypothetical protein
LIRKSRVILDNTSFIASSRLLKQFYNHLSRAKYNYLWTYKLHFSSLILGRSLATRNFKADVIPTMNFLLVLLVQLGNALTAPSIIERQPSPAISTLPDPFTSFNGTHIITKSDWVWRQAEIPQLFQSDELGTKPPAPSSIAASFSSNTLTVKCSQNSKSITFSAPISYPTTGKGPYPLLIALDGLSIPTPSGVAVLTLTVDTIAAQNNAQSRGQGLFYDLYGSSHSAGAMTAWAWAVSRVIDALTLTPSTNIDLTHIGVTGCSRDGKGAFVAGALEPRTALTIAQESGSGGAACWRISDQQLAQGNKDQTASEIVQENVWFSPLFDAYVNDTATLPFDHHMLAGLVAPRGLYVIENDIEWLGPVSTTGCMEIGRSIYEALGVSDNMGFSLVGGHAHCAFPAAQQEELDAFVGRFLLGQNVSTAGIVRSSFNVSLADWMDWSVPNLVE